MKKPFIFFFVVLILFNVLNIIDKITTYYGVKQGFWEQNIITAKFFGIIGILPTLILQVFIGLISSLLIYLVIINISIKIKHIDKIIALPIIFLSLIYFEAVINNTRLLLG